MTRAEVREFIRLGVAAIDRPILDFGSGRLTEFNSKRNNVYPKVWLISPDVTSDYGNSAPLDKWAIELYVVARDSMGASEEDYEDLVDQSDYLAQRLIYQYRQIIEGYKLTAIESAKRVPWIQKNADDLTGVILSFDVINTDQTNVCP